MSSENRVPAGVPTGGQFAQSTRDEAGVGLGAAQEPRPGSLLAACPDCGEEMVGHIGDGHFLPGSQCDHCPYVTGDLSVETDSLYDTDGRTYLYSLDTEGAIRVTDDDGDTVSLHTLDSADWEGVNPFRDVDRDLVERAASFNADPGAYLESESADEGLPIMGGVYQVLVDREEVPRATLLSASDEGETGWLYDSYIRDGMYALESRHRGGVSERDPAATDLDMHTLEATCQKAGLPVMAKFYRAVADGEGLSGQAARDFTPEEVKQDYYDLVAPRIDNLNIALVARSQSDG